MYKRILTIQDISCVGQCSLTVALPILSACGLETCILPSAVLSTHTAGFKGFTFRDLTDDLPAISEHWKKEGITFDAIYTGYLGSTKQIGFVRDIMKANASDECVKIVDPAMADGGKLYPLFDDEYVRGMKELCGDADIILPNITEACFLTGSEYRETYEEDYIEALVGECAKVCGGATVLTGVGYDEESTGVLVAHKGSSEYYRHRRISRGCHGTGDVYASAFVGALMRGKSDFEAARIAADYTVSCIEHTQPYAGSHWYGVMFEPVLPNLIEMLSA